MACRVLKLHRQHYYAWLANPITDRERQEAYLTNALFDAHSEDSEFGYRVLFDEVSHTGQVASERTVWKILLGQPMVVRVRQETPRQESPARLPPAHEDLVRRRFSALGPNRLWLTDISEHPTRAGKLYICAVKDAWSNLIVGYSMAERMTSHLAVNAVESAVARRGGTVAGCTVHSDRGGQLRSRRLAQCLARYGMVASMGQVASSLLTGYSTHKPWWRHADAHHVRRGFDARVQHVSHDGRGSLAAGAA